MSPQRHWADIEGAGFVLGMRLMVWIERHLGRWAFRLCLVPVLGYYWLTQVRARNVSRAYQCRLARHLGRALPGPLASLRHLFVFSEAVLDKLLAWSGHIKDDQVDIDADGALLAAVASGRGGVIITCHIGNPELSNALSNRCNGLRLNILTHTLHATTFNRLLGRLDPRSQVNLLQVTDITPAMAIQLAAKVQAGEFVVIAADRIPVARRSAVVMVPFLGETAPMPVGPWLLASLLQCPVYLLWSYKRPDGRYRVALEPFREQVVLPRHDRGGAAGDLAADYARRMEAVLAESPLQWFNFFDFWTIPPHMDYQIWTRKS